MPWSPPRVTPGAASLLGIYIDAAYNVVSANLSSPQTTELFAQDRADTLWKHVIRADAQLAGYTLLGMIVANAEQPGAWIWPLVGAGTAGVIMHLSYAVALSQGQQQAGQQGGLARARWRAP